MAKKADDKVYHDDNTLYNKYSEFVDKLINDQDIDSDSDKLDNCDTGKELSNESDTKEIKPVEKVKISNQKQKIFPKKLFNRLSAKDEKSQSNVATSSGDKNISSGNCDSAAPQKYSYYKTDYTYKPRTSYVPLNKYYARSPLYEPRKADTPLNKYHKVNKTDSLSEKVNNNPYNSMQYDGDTISSLIMKISDMRKRAAGSLIENMDDDICYPYQTDQIDQINHINHIDDENDENDEDDKNDDSLFGSLFEIKEKKKTTNAIHPKPHIEYFKAIKAEFDQYDVIVNNKIAEITSTQQNKKSRKYSDRSDDEDEEEEDEEDDDKCTPSFLNSKYKQQKFHIIYTELCKCNNKDSVYRHDFLEYFKDIIFSPEYTDENGKTILHKAIENENYAMYDILSCPLCDINYLSHRCKNGYNAIFQLIRLPSHYMQPIMKIHRIKNSNLNQYLFDYMPNHMFNMIRYQRIDTLYTFMDEMFHNQPLSARPYSKLYEINEYDLNRYSGYSILTFLLDNLDQLVTNELYCRDVFNKILTSSWFTRETLLHILQLLFNDKSLSSILTLSTVISHSQSMDLSSAILLTPSYTENKCLLNIAVESLLTSKELSQQTGINRLEFLMRNSDEMTVTRLLTCNSFTKDEYTFTDCGGRNCILLALKSKPSLLPILVSSDYFEPGMVRVVDDMGNGLMHYMKSYCPSNNEVKNLYKMFFPESESVDENFEGDIMCKLCMERKVNIRLDPCGHTMCSCCISDRFESCPYCSKGIDNFQHIIFS